MHIFGSSGYSQKIEINGSKEISLVNVDPEALRKNICNAQAKKKANPNTKGGNPSKRILIDANLSKPDWLKVINGSNEIIVPITKTDIEKNKDIFILKSEEDSREKVTRAIAIRQGQPQFRKKILTAYENCCAISGSGVPEILEAAHIVPYNGKDTNKINNGILLRSDIHTLFDLGLIGISENYEILISSKLKDTEYELFHEKTLNLPANKKDYPSINALKTRAIPKV